MNMDYQLVGPLSALFGALAGGLASLIGAIYTHRRNARLQRAASEIAKRETIYADFVMSASNLLLKAYTSDVLQLSGDEQRAIGLLNRMRIFASPEIIATAEAVLKAIVEISLQPGVQLRELAVQALSKSPDPDPLLTFSLVCRADLDNVRRTTV
jgi:hypothetical protein